VTCAVASDDAKYLFTAGKDGHIIHWDLTTGKRLSTFYKRKPKQTEQTNGSSKGKSKGKDKAYGQNIDGHTDEVLALALSADGKYLASGGRDRKVGVWGVENGEWVKGLSGHRDTVSVSALTHPFPPANPAMPQGPSVPKRNATALQRIARSFHQII
jgi:ribosomal RNA-processing protein 9